MGSDREAQALTVMRVPGWSALPARPVALPTPARTTKTVSNDDDDDVCVTFLLVSALQL